jgi:hypothetical protein
MKRVVLLIAVALLAGGGAAVAPAAAPTAAAAPCVVIYRVYFDSPGSDTGSNSSLNAEWIKLKNRCSTNKSLTGWTIKDKAGHTYRFGTYTLRAASYVKVHTGKGTNTRTDRYWGKGWYIWNNTGDTAYVRNSAGTLSDSCTFSGAGSDAYC